jgi:mono/diheme cytochrome c family protein
MVLAFAAACESGPTVSDRVLQSASARAAGAELFAANCAICHGPRADGRGVRRAGFDTAAPSFRSRAWRDSTSPAKIVEVIRQGKKPTSMPAWPGLSDEQVGELVAYLWSLAEEPAP